jgi:prevent-host-death family protein
MTPTQWQVQEAKQRFSEVIRAAETGQVQVITRHGQAVAVVLDIAAYRHLRGESASLMDYLRVEADAADDFAIERTHEGQRKIDLVG